MGKRSWPLQTVVHEGLSNLRFNRLRSALHFVIIVVVVFVGGYTALDASDTADLRAEIDRRAGRDAGVIVAANSDLRTVDASSCAAIGLNPHIIRAGAVLDQRIVTTSLGVSFPLLAVTDGYLEVAADEPIAASDSLSPGILLADELAVELGVAEGSFVEFDDQIVSITAVIRSDIRDSALTRAGFQIVPAVGKGSACAIEGEPGMRSFLDAETAALLGRHSGNSFTFFVADKDLFKPPSSSATRSSALVGLIALAAILLLSHRIRSGELAVYTASGCSGLDRWWLIVVEALPVLVAATITAMVGLALVSGERRTTHATLVIGLMDAGVSGCACLVLISAVAAVPFRGSLLSRLKDRT